VLHLVHKDAPAPVHSAHSVEQVMHVLVPESAYVPAVQAVERMHALVYKNNGELHEVHNVTEFPQVLQLASHESQYFVTALFQNAAGQSNLHSDTYRK